MPFGSGTASVITGATWASTNGGTATITAPNLYVAGQTVSVAGITGQTGFNGTVVVLSATANQFTYHLATQPTGTLGLTAATSEVVPTVVTTVANNPSNSGQTPLTVTIGTDLNGNTNQLLADAGNQFTLGGVNSIDGPFEVNGDLPTNSGNSITIYGTGANQNFPTATDRFGNFVTSAQFAVSPDGQSVFVADSRTDGLGGVLWYYQVVGPTPSNPDGTWRLYGNLQLDTFGITGASESGSTVTVTTSSPTDFYVGESVSVNGLTLTAYDGTETVTGVSGNSFTYTGAFTGLNPTGVLPGNVANATDADGGVRGLTADFTDNGANDGGVILYVTTSGTSGNRLIEVTGGNWGVNSTPNTLVDPLLSTAAPGTAFRGVAFAPVAAGTTTTGESIGLAASGNTLTATVAPSGATGLVDFYQSNGTYIGAASVTSGSASLNVTGILPAGTYTGVYATYTGNATYAPITSAPTNLTVSLASTTTTLSFSPNPVGTSQSDTLTATIGVAAGTGAPNGTVAFTNPGATGNIATVSVSGTTVTVTTTAPVAFVVGQTVTIAGNSGTNINGPFTITAVSGTASGTTFKYTSASAVAGTGGTAVSTAFTLGTGTVSSVISSGVISYVTTLTEAASTFAYGSYNVQATYAGTAYFASSSDTAETLTVVNSTTTTVTSNLANPTAATGQALTLTATVSSTVSGTGTGTIGSVQFYDDTLLLGQTPTNPTGAYPVTNGMATLTLNTSLVQSVTVLQASASTTMGTTTVTLTTDASNPMAVGEYVTVEGLTNSVYNSLGNTNNNYFQVTAVSGNTFSYVDAAANGAATLGSTTSLGIGLAIGLDILTPGLHSITAVFTSTSSSFAGSTGVHEQSVSGQAMGATDVFTEREGNGITPLNVQAPQTTAGAIGSTLYIDELTSSGTLVQSFILPSADSQIFTVTNAVWSGGVATITTTAPTDYVIGQTVTISGITGTTGTSYNGNVVVTGVGTNTFSFVLATQPTGTAVFTGATVQGAVHAVVGDGQQSTTGQLSLSGNGQYLFLTGYDNNPLPYGTALHLPSGSNSTTVTRSIAQISPNGTVLTEALSSSIDFADSFNQIDGIYSPDGNQFYVSTSDNATSGDNGIFYFSAFTQSATPQGSIANEIVAAGSSAYNSLESYGGNLYAVGGGSTSGASASIVQVGSGLPVSDISTITAVNWASGVATLTANNNYVVGETVIVTGITGTTGTSYNGTVTITAVVGTVGNLTGFSYALTTQPTGTPVVTGATASLQVAVTQLPGIPVNSKTDVIPIYTAVDAYFTNLSGSGTTADTVYIADEGKGYGSGGITKWTLTSEAISSLTVSGTTATATVASGLGLAEGEALNLTIVDSASSLNGVYAVTVSGSNPNQFTFTVPSGTVSGTTGTASGFVEQSNGILYAESAPQLGFYWLAGSTNPTTHVVTLYTTYGNGGNADTGPGITYATTDAEGFGNSPGLPITAAAYSSGSNTVTITTNGVYSLQVGSLVNVAGITGATGYNGLFTITAVGTSGGDTTFSYTPTTTPSGTPVITAGTTSAVSVNTVNTVAFEGVGNYVGFETTHGVALTPVFGVVSTTPTPDGFVLKFNEPINPATTVLYSSPGDTVLGSADVIVTGPQGTVRGSLVIDPTNPNVATFIQTSGLLAAGTWTVTVTTAVRAANGSALAGNYSSTLTVTAPTTPVLTVPPFARGPGQTVALTDSLGNTTGIPISISSATPVTQVGFSLTYDPQLLTIAGSGALSLSSAATSAGLVIQGYTITSVDASHSILNVSISGGTGFTATTTAPLVTILASVPTTAPYLDKAVLNLGNVMVNSAAATGVSSASVVAYPGDVLGTGVPNATDASLVDQVASGSGTGFSVFKDLDPVIIGGVEGGLLLNANDASLIDEAASGASVSQIPSIPVGVSLTFGGPDPYLYLSAVQGSPGQTVTETLYLDVTDPKGIQLTALDEAIGFDAGALQISDVRGTGALAAFGSYDTASTVDSGSGEFLVAQAFMGTGLPPVVPYGTDIPVLEFNVTLNADMGVGSESGLTLLQDGTVNNVTQYTAISDNEGALTWTPGKAPSNSGNASIDGSVLVVAPTAPVVAEPVASAPQSPVVVPPRVIEPVRRITPVASMPVTNVVPASAVNDVASTSVEETVVTTVSPLQPSAVVSGQPVTFPANSVVTVMPAELASVTNVSNQVKLSDPGVSLSLVALETSKAVPTASTGTSNVKATTSVLDEMYRQFGSAPGTSQMNGWNAGASGDDAVDVWSDAVYLEAELYDLNLARKSEAADQE